MIVDLNPLPYKLSLNIIEWCYDNNIDREKVTMLTNEFSVTASHRDNSIEWTLDIPDKYVTMLILKFI